MKSQPGLHLPLRAEDDGTEEYGRIFQSHETHEMHALIFRLCKIRTPQEMHALALRSK